LAEFVQQQQFREEHAGRKSTMERMIRKRMKRRSRIRLLLL
jgi:hypothetical protein